MESDGNVIMIHKGETALLAAVNEALAKAMAEGKYSPWYAEAKEMAGLDTAVEVSIEDEPAEGEAAGG
jgi:ABC-type amino acid transport substrate-binding protein